MTEDQRERGIYEPYQGKLSDTRVVPLQVWVCHDMIRGPGVQSSSGGSTSSVGRVLLCIGVDSG